MQRPGRSLHKVKHAPSRELRSRRQHIKNKLSANIDPCARHANGSQSDGEPIASQIAQRHRHRLAAGCVAQAAQRYVRLRCARKQKCSRSCCSSAMPAGAQKAARHARDGKVGAQRLSTSKAWYHDLSGLPDSFSSRVASPET